MGILFIDIIEKVKTHILVEHQQYCQKERYKVFTDIKNKLEIELKEYYPKVYIFDATKDNRNSTRQYVIHNLNNDNGNDIIVSFYLRITLSRTKDKNYTTIKDIKILNKDDLHFNLEEEIQTISFNRNLLENKANLLIKDKLIPEFITLTKSCICKMKNNAPIEYDMEKKLESCIDNYNSCLSYINNNGVNKNSNNNSSNNKQ